ncbi:hypothetical protein H0W26_02665 [Candidatus Dependentiae bacterium]|nr:hypothetical protein [Candidatus Dependentiae bacterium]
MKYQTNKVSSLLVLSGSLIGLPIHCMDQMYQLVTSSPSPSTQRNATYTLPADEVVSPAHHQVLQGHTNKVPSVAFSSEGALILTGSHDKTACVWDTTTGKQREFLPEPDSLIQLEDTFVDKADSHDITSVACSPDGTSFLTGSSNKTACLWDPLTGKVLKILKGHTHWITSVAFNCDGSMILTGSWDKTARLWNVSTGEIVQIFKGHTKCISSVTFNLDGKTIITGSGDGTACIWDRETGKLMRVLEGHKKPIWSVASSPCGKTILTGSGDTTARLWDSTTGKLLKEFRGHTDSITSVAHSSDGKNIVTGSRDKTARLWDSTTGELLKEFKGHTDSITSVACSWDKNIILTGSADTTACIWNSSTGTQLLLFKGHTEAINSLGFSAEGNVVITGSCDGTIRLWDILDGVTLRQYTNSYYEEKLSITPQSSFLQKRTSYFHHIPTEDHHYLDSINSYPYISDPRGKKRSNSADKTIPLGRSPLLKRTSTGSSRLHLATSSAKKLSIPHESTMLPEKKSPSRKGHTTENPWNMYQSSLEDTTSKIEDNELPETLFRPSFHKRSTTISSGSYTTDYRVKKLQTQDKTTLLPTPPPSRDELRPKDAGSLYEGSLDNRNNNAEDKEASFAPFKPSFIQRKPTLSSVSDHSTYRPEKARVRHEPALSTTKKSHPRYVLDTEARSSSSMQEPKDSKNTTSENKITPFKRPLLLPRSTTFSSVSYPASYKAEKVSIQQESPLLPKKDFPPSIVVGTEDIPSFSMQEPRDSKNTTSEDKTVPLKRPAPYRQSTALPSRSYISGYHAENVRVPHESTLLPQKDFLSSNPLATDDTSNFSNPEQIDNKKSDSTDEEMVLEQFKSSFKPAFPERTGTYSSTDASSHTNHLNFTPSLKDSTNNLIAKEISNSEDKAVSLDYQTPFTGHTREITSVACSPNGTTILTGAHDKNACLWDTLTGKLLRVFTGHTGFISSVAYSPSSRTVLTGSWDKTAILWDITTGQQVRQFKGHTHWITSVAFSPDKSTILTGSADSTACIWDSSTGVLIATFKIDQKMVGAVAFSPEGDTIITGSADKIARLWDVKTGQELHQLKGHTDCINSVAFSPDGKTVLTGSRDKTACLWDTKEGRLLKTFKGHTDQIRSVGFSPYESLIVTGSSDSTARLWNIQTGNQIRLFKAASKESPKDINSVAFSPEGNTIITGSADTTACLWDSSTGICLRRYTTACEAENLNNETELRSPLLRISSPNALLPTIITPQRTQKPLDLPADVNQFLG